MRNLKGEVKLDLATYNEMMERLARFENAIRVTKSNWSDEKYLEVYFDFEMVRDVVLEKYDATGIDKAVYKLNDEMNRASTTLGLKIEKEEAAE
jgi:hypothetical protein